MGTIMICLLIIFMNGYFARKINKAKEEFEVKKEQYENETNMRSETLKKIANVCYEHNLLDQESYEEVIRLCEMLKY